MSLGAKFRCCGNRTVEGHAPSCPIKEAEARCQFDIYHFRHIGECKGTCSGEEGIAQFGCEDAEDGKLHIVLVDLTDATPEQLANLEKRGLRHLTEEEMLDIIAKEARGELKVQVTTMTLEQLEEEFSIPPDEKPDDPLLTVHKAARALGFSDGWVRTLCRNDKLPGALKLMRKWAIPTSAIFEKEAEA